MSITTRANATYSNSMFIDYLMTVATGLIWKDTQKAIDNESEDTNEVYRAELFVVANRGLLNFDIVKSFPRSVLLNAGVTDTVVDLYATDKSRIPTYLRDQVVAEYETALTSTNPTSGRPAYYNTLADEYETIYEEQNKYYRMLMGLPDVDDTDYVYNTDDRWDTTIPVHELSYVNRIEMEREGILDELIAANPDKEYLKYLGEKYIDPFTARIAGRFEILWYEECDSTLLNEDFVGAYNSARDVVLSVYYNNFYRKSNDLYDNFIAMTILFMAIEVMCSKYMEADITRDFYDTESLKLIYDSYSVPYHSEIPLEYHRKIVKNINKLISYKGSPKVFLELFDIFDLSYMDIYVYYLTKIHKFKNGKPTFVIKKDEDGNDMYDDDGYPILDDSNFEYRFAKVPIDADPALGVSDDANKVDYEDLTVDDPYWIEDQDLIDHLNESNFNFMESKYIGIQAVFDLMKMMLESAYMFRLITDQKDLTADMTFYWQDLQIDATLYHIFIYLAAIYCRYYGYEGEITGNIPAIMETYGYDFDAAYELLTNVAEADPIISSNKELMDLIMSINITNIVSVNTTYDTIMDIMDIIIDGYTNATTIEEFNAYRELYYSLMTSYEVTRVYTNEDGEIYSSFTDILADESVELMQRYLLLEDDELADELIIIIDMIEDLMTSSKFLMQITGLGISSLIEPLFKILKFFKSAKVELTNYEIIFEITARGFNFLKMMDLIFFIFTHVWLNPDETYFIDILHRIHEVGSVKYEYIKMLEEVTNIHVKNYLQYDYIDRLTDLLVKISTIVVDIFKEEQWFIDFMQSIKSNVNLITEMILTDTSELMLKSIEYLEAKYKESFKDYILELTDKISLDEGENGTLYYIDEYCTLIDEIKLIRNTYYPRFESTMNFDDELISIEKDKIYEDILYWTKDTFSILIVWSLLSSNASITDVITSAQMILDTKEAGPLSDDQFLFELFDEVKSTYCVATEMHTGDALYEHDSEGNMIQVS